MIGVNTYGLIDIMQADFTGTLRVLVDTGFEAVEGLVVPKKDHRDLPLAITSESSFPAFAGEVKKYGMTIPSVHVFNRKGNRFLPRESVLRTVRELRHEFGVTDFVFSGAFSDAKGARFWAEYLSDLVQALQGDDCHILYHNHDHELTEICVDGEKVQAIDYFFRLLDRNVLLELDIGWAGNVSDEVVFAKRYADRIRTLHLKDFVHGSRGKYRNPYVPKELFVAIGEGEIKTKEILRLRNSLPNFSGSVIIDQDFSAGNMLEDLQTGFRNVENMMRGSQGV